MRNPKLCSLLLPCLSLALGACEGEHLIYYVSYTSVGEAARISVSAEPGVAVTVESETKTASDEGELNFYLAYAKLSPGPNTLTLHAERDGKTQQALLAITAPTPDPGPFLQLHECPNVPTASGDQAGIGLDLRGDFGGVDGCQDSGDAPLELIATATPGASVHIGDAVVPAGPNGELRLPLDVSGDVLDMSPPTEGEERGQIVVPVRVELEGSEPLEGNIELSADTRNMVDDFARAFEPGKPLHPELSTKDGGFLLFRKSDYDTRIVGEPGPLRQTRLIALTTEVGRTEAKQSCGPYEDLDGGSSLSLTRYDVDLEVVVYDAASGAERARKTFEGSTGECPVMVTVDLMKENSTTVEPSTGDMIAWLEEVLGSDDPPSTDG